MTWWCNAWPVARPISGVRGLGSARESFILKLSPSSYPRTAFSPRTTRTTMEMPARTKVGLGSVNMRSALKNILHWVSVTAHITVFEQHCFSRLTIRWIPQIEVTSPSHTLRRSCQSYYTIRGKRLSIGSSINICPFVQPGNHQFW